MSKNIVRVRLPMQPPVSDLAVGEIIDLWGHNFAMQKDGVLVCDMDACVAKIELAAKRVVRYVPEDFQVVDDAFTMDIGNYYGAGDLETLRKKIEKLTSKSDIQEFVDQRLSMSWPDKMTREDMINNTCNAIEKMRSGDAA